jgi:hypothetical protein
MIVFHLAYFLIGLLVFKLLYKDTLIITVMAILNDRDRATERFIKAHGYTKAAQICVRAYTWTIVLCWPGAVVMAFYRDFIQSDE